MSFTGSYYWLLVLGFLANIHTSCGVCYETPDGIMGLYKFEDGGNLALSSASYPDPPVTYFTSATPTTTTGKVGDAAVTFESEGLEIITNHGDGDIFADFTLEFWVRLITKPTRTTNLFTKINGTGIEALLSSNTRVSTRFVTTQGPSSQSDITPSLDVQWHHVAMTYYSVDNMARFYFNGNIAGLTSTHPCCINDTGIPFKIGHDLHLAIDEVSIYNRPLLSEEISGIFMAGEDGKCNDQVPSEQVPSQAPVSVEPTNKVIALESLGATCSNNSFCVFLNQNVELAGELDLRGITIKVQGNISFDSAVITVDEKTTIIVEGCTSFSSLTVSLDSVVNGFELFNSYSLCDESSVSDVLVKHASGCSSLKSELSSTRALFFIGDILPCSSVSIRMCSVQLVMILIMLLSQL